ncbi:MAG: tetratricopeptide repeat protein [Woronichinia naegeliana WA131]|uniref:Tetratricopeptide repeat protein n=1 Tax=Woronichinia naegeliana WA131 TaxID=2824559 RepID=A0A977KRY5_9CYAN|nr:MAG: tetratricopeptide repeat protein [Woronichinia naegeliana WA131]
MGKSEEAIARYQKILEINPHIAAAYCNLGCIWQMQGKV